MLEPIRSCVEVAIETLQREYLGEQRELVARLRVLDFRASVLRLVTAKSFPAGFHERFCARLADILEARLGRIEVRVVFPRQRRERESEIFVHATNKILAQLFENVAAGEAGRYRRINVYGDAGVGKTFLVEKKLIAAASVPCTYYTAERFSTEVVTRMLGDGRSIAAWRRELEQSQVLVLDEVHRLSGKMRVQIELRRILDVMESRRALVVLLGRHHPHKILKFDHTLATRMLSSYTHKIGEPPLETRRAFVRSHGIPDTHPDFGKLTCLARSFGVIERNLRQLRPDAPDLEPREGDAREDILERLLDRVARAYSCAVDELRDPRSSRRLTEPRHVVVFVARSAGISGAEISRRMGYSSASSANYAVRKVEQKMASDPNFRAVVRSIL